MFGVPRSTVYGHLDKTRIGTRPAAPYDPAMGNDAEHLRVMADVVREVWRLAQGWARDDDTEPMAGDLFTAVSPLLAWEDEHQVPHTVPS